MSALEILFFATLCAFAASIFLPVRLRSRAMCLVSALALGLAALQCLSGEFRRALVPGYFSAAVFFVFALRKPRGGRVFLRFVGAIFSVFVVLVAAVFPLATPRFDLPRVSGQYSVGTSYHLAVDLNRPETFTAEEHDRREVAFEIWYPATTDDLSVPEPYQLDHSEEINEIVKAHTLSQTTIPRFLAWFLFAPNRHALTQAYRDAQPARTASLFPVLIFSPGYSSAYNGYVSLLQDLASRGYVVVSIAHPFQTPFAILPNGKVRGYPPDNQEYLRHLRELSDPKWGRAVLRVVQAADEGASEQAHRQFRQVNPLYQDTVRLWAGDIRFIIDHLGEMHRSGFLAGSMDLSKIGVLGHSIGGAVAAQVLATDDRVTAGVNMDGFQFGDLVDRHLERPFLFFSGEAAPGAVTSAAFNDFYFRRATGDVYSILIRGSLHANFSDASIYGGLMAWVGEIGEIEGERFLRILNESLGTFFDTYLRGTDPRRLRDLDSRYPEVALHWKPSHGQ